MKIEEPKELPKTDYVIRNKKIWKGKTAPIGYKYIALYLRTKTGKYTNVILVPGGLTAEEEQTVGEMLRDGLRKRYKI